MNKIKQALNLLFFGIILSVFLVSLNYTSEEFDVPKELLFATSIAFLLLSVLVSKRRKIPKENKIGLAIFINCSIGLSIIIAIDHYIVEFFEYNIFWMAAAYLPVPLYIVIITKRNETNS